MAPIDCERGVGTLVRNTGKPIPCRGARCGTSRRHQGPLRAGCAVGAETGARRIRGQHRSYANAALGVDNIHQSSCEQKGNKRSLHSLWLFEVDFWTSEEKYGKKCII